MARAIGPVDVLVVRADASGVWAGAVRGGRLDDLSIVYADDRTRVGARFLGRVVKVDKALNAAFVDIGEARWAFLKAHAADPTGTLPPKIDRRVHEGQLLAVRVERPPFDDKGAQVSVVEGAPAEGDIGGLDAGPDPLAAAIAPFREAGIGRAVAGDAATKVRLRGLLSENAEVEAAPPGGDPFELAGVADDLAAAQEPTIELPGGGRLTIEQTRALVAVDVDSGDANEPALSVNCAAVEKVARQLRVRNLGGTIVVDAISLRRRGDRDAVIDAFRRALANDRLAVKVLGWTRLGLIEVQRERTGQGLI